MHGQELHEDPPKDISKCKTRIMYVENKGTGLATISKVYYSKSGRSLYYKGKKLTSLKGAGFKSNYIDIENGVHYWVSGPKKRGGNRLYGGDAGLVIDDDVAEEYNRNLV